MLKSKKKKIIWKKIVLYSKLIIIKIFDNIFKICMHTYKNVLVRKMILNKCIFKEHKYKTDIYKFEKKKNSLFFYIVGFIHFIYFVGYGLKL